MEDGSEFSVTIEVFQSNNKNNYLDFVTYSQAFFLKRKVSIVITSIEENFRVFGEVVPSDIKERVSFEGTFKERKIEIFMTPIQASNIVVSPAKPQNLLGFTVDDIEYRYLDD